MRLPSPTAVGVGVAAALSSQVVVYLIIESTCVTSRRAFSWTESSYTVGVIWGRPRFRKPRLEPHRPARNRPARRSGAGDAVQAGPELLVAARRRAEPRVAARLLARRGLRCRGRGCRGVRIDVVPRRAELGGR